MPRAEFLAFRKSLGRTPPLERMTVRARGIEFAVWTSAPVSDRVPLLMVNGGMLYDHALLWPALSPLAADRQVILYDQRGRGESQAPSDVQSATVVDDAADIPALRRALGIRRWDVLGHSWGGGIALLGVSLDSAATRRLVTVNAVGPTSSWMTELHARALDRVDDANREQLIQLATEITLPAPDIQSAHARAMYPAWFADSDFASYFTPPEAASETGAMILSKLRAHGYDWRARLSAIQVPTLIVHGTADALPPTVATELSAVLPRASIQWIENAGHMPFWENPGDFFLAVTNFLDSTGVSFR